jgi:hypothetical protein
MPFSRLLSAAVVASALLSLPGSAPAFAQGASPAQPVLRSAKERGNPLAEPSLVGGLTKEKRFSLCIESWDAQTHMSKREWRAACERSVKDYPTAFQ